MKKSHYKIICLLLIFNVAVTGTLKSHINKIGHRNIDFQKDVKVNNDKIAANDFNLNSVDSQLVKTNSINKPDSEIVLKDENKNEVYEVVENMPQFQGGAPALYNFINRNIRYPSEAVQNNIEGKVVVRFVVSENGKVEKAEILKSLDTSCNREALRVIKSLPAFIPGSQNGKNVAVWYSLPITFKRESPQTKYNIKEEWVPTDETIVVYNRKRMPSNFDISKIDMAKVVTIALIKPESNFDKQKLILQYGNGAEYGAIVINDHDSKNDIDSLKNFIKIDDNNYVFAKLKKGPKFPGGENLAKDFINQNLVYPATARMNNIQGKVEIQFVVDKTGKVRNPRIVGKVDQMLANAALDVIYKFPDWIAAEYDGKKVNALYTLPFEFNLETKNKSDDSNGEKVYQVIEQMPVFPGGEEALMKFISKNIKYPVKAQQNRIQGRVIVRFVVSKTGQVDRVEVIRTLDPDCDQEAIRVIKLLPNFIPGKQNRKDVSVWYTLPITFKLESSPKNSVYKEHASSEIIDGSKPLYLIDEKPATEAEVKALNPQDIKEVKVLKDATATALYGSRAANGVVLITMKK